MSAAEADKDLRIAVLISGGGTNLQALLDSLPAHNTSTPLPRLSNPSAPLPPQARITLVLSSKTSAYGLTRASSCSPPIPTLALPLKPYQTAHPGASRADWEQAVADEVLARAKPDLIVLAGWMMILSPAFLNRFKAAGRGGAEVPIINLHPALPGAFDGANAIPRALEAFMNGEVKGTGVMVHRVIPEVDRGEPLVVREVEISEDDELEKLEERIHQTEWEVIVEGARKVLAEVQERSGA